MIDVRPFVRELSVTDISEKDFRNIWSDRKLRWSIAKQIRALRESKGWSQAELARRIESHPSIISGLEDPTSESWPTLSTLQRIAAAFDVALSVRFVAWSEFLDFVELLEIGWTVPPSFDEEFPADEPVIDRVAEGKM